MTSSGLPVPTAHCDCSCLYVLWYETWPVRHWICFVKGFENGLNNGLAAPETVVVEAVTVIIHLAHYGMNPICVMFVESIRISGDAVLQGGDIVVNKF